MNKPVTEIIDNLFNGKDRDYQIMAFIIMDCIYKLRGKDYYIGLPSIRDKIYKRLMLARISWDSPALRAFQLRLER